MTASALSLPASFELVSSAISNLLLSPDEVATELRLIELLRSSGFGMAAERRLESLVARAPHSEIVESARLASITRQEVDAWLAEQHGNVSRTLIPSATLNLHGTPRFVIAMPRDASNALVDAIARELSGMGADAELRNFLDEALSDEVAFIDFDPGLGFAAFSAATAPKPPAAAYAVTFNAGAILALDAGVEASALSERVQVVRNVGGTITVDRLVTEALNDVREFMIHAGSASAIPAVVHGALGTIRDGRVSAITWHCTRSPVESGDPILNDAEFAHEIDNAGTVLAVLGFEHFALAQVNDEVELVPLATVSGNTLIISLSREFIARTGSA